MLKPKTIKRYLTGLRSLCLDYILNMATLEIYGHQILQKIIAGFRKVYGERDTCERRQITLDIWLMLISRFDQTTSKGANLNAAFCLTFAGFLQIGELTYNKVESDFRAWHLTCGSISLQEDWVLLVFPASKTNPFCQGVIWTISTSCNKAYAVKFLCNLFEQFFKSHYCLLFSPLSGIFNCGYVIRNFREDINILGYEENYTGHSFRRRAETSARLTELLDKEIQLLGKWKLNSYWLYINTFSEWIYNASSRHQRSHPFLLQISSRNTLSSLLILTCTGSSRIPQPY